MARLLLSGALATVLPSCGGGSPASPSGGAPPALQGRYLLSVRPGTPCSSFPVPTLEVELVAATAGGRIEIGGENATGSFQPQGDAGSGFAGLLEVFASDVALGRGVSDTSRGDFYVFAQATGSLSQAGGRNEVRGGQLAGSVTVFRTLEGATRTDRCSVSDHSFSLVAR